MNNFRSLLYYRDSKSRSVRENCPEDFSHGASSSRSFVTVIFWATKVFAGLIATYSDNSLRDLEKVFSEMFHSVYRGLKESFAPVARNLAPRKRQGGGGKRKTKESLSRRAMITRCNRYEPGPGVADTAIYVRVYTVDG